MINMPEYITITYGAQHSFPYIYHGEDGMYDVCMYQNSIRGEVDDREKRKFMRDLADKLDGNVPLWWNDMAYNKTTLQCLSPSKEMIGDFINLMKRLRLVLDEEEIRKDLAYMSDSDRGKRYAVPVGEYKILL